MKHFPSRYTTTPKFHTKKQKCVSTYF